MTLKKTKMIFTSLASAMLLVACSTQAAQTTKPTDGITTSTQQVATSSKDGSYFTDKDYETSYDAKTASTITLSGNTATVSGDGVSVDGTTVTISQGGTYVISGQSEGVSIVISAGDSDDVHLILDNATMSADSAPIAATKANHVTVTLAEGTSNSLSDSSHNTDEDADAALFSKVDLTINGQGALTVTGNTNNGIKANDTLHMTGGQFTITAKGDAFNVNDELNITNTTMTITADEDAVKVDNDEDLSVGNMYLADNTMTISAGDDAIHASGSMIIDSGTYTITTSTEGIEATNITINDGTIDIYATDDGINAANSNASMDQIFFTMNGGQVKVEVAQGDTDAIDSNGNITVNGGTLELYGQTSTFDFDGTATFNGGTIYENGVESSEIVNSMMMGGGPMGQGGPGQR